MKNILLLIFAVLFSWQPGNAQQTISKTMEHQELEREYVVHLPPGYTGNTPLPVVITLHGGSGNKESIQGFSQMNDVSDLNNFLAVYPQGIGIAPPGFSWADGRGTSADVENIDDVGFIDKLIDTLANNYNVDSSKIYVCGFSNGGFMTQRLACEIPERFAAMGSLGASLYDEIIQTCTPSVSVPMAYFSGTTDPLIPFAGGRLNDQAVSTVTPVDTAVQFWVNHNNCQLAEPVVNLPNTVASDNSTVEFFKFSDCDCEAEVWYYKIINGGHTWPGVPTSRVQLLGNTNEDIHASFILWDFFQSHSSCNLITNIDEQVKKPLFRIYPNPTKDLLTIVSSLPLEKVVLYDFMGRKVLTDDHNEINLSRLMPGSYLLFATFTNKSVETRTVIKQ